MQRAQKTAGLAGFPKFEVTPLLQEYDYGEYEGITTQEVRRERPGWQLFRDGCPGGETPDQVYRRAERFVDLVAAKTAEGRVIAFAHGHILRTVAAAWIGQPIELAERLSLDTASLSVLREGDRGRVLRLWNDTGDL
jgi:probable phosphoglycerate mutase